MHRNRFCFVLHKSLYLLYFSTQTKSRRKKWIKTKCSIFQLLKMSKNSISNHHQHWSAAIEWNVEVHMWKQSRKRVKKKTSTRNKIKIRKEKKNQNKRRQIVYRYTMLCSIHWSTQYWNKSTEIKEEEAIARATE